MVVSVKLDFPPRFRTVWSTGCLSLSHPGFLAQGSVGGSLQGSQRRRGPSPASTAYSNSVFGGLPDELLS